MPGKKITLLVGLLTLVALLVGACGAADEPTATPTTAGPAPTATPTTTGPAPTATPTTTGPAPTATPTVTGAGEDAVAGGDFSMADFTGLIGSTECPLCPPGLGEAYPPIAKYHWSKLPNPNLKKPVYGGILRGDLRYDPTNWDPFTGNVGTYVWGNLPYSRLVTHDITMHTAFNTGGANMYPLVTVCDVCESWEVTGPNEYTFKIRDNVKFHNFAPVNGRLLTAKDLEFSYNLYMDPAAFQQYAVTRNWASVDAPDDTTFIITTKVPEAGLIDSMTHPAFSIFAEEAYNREGGLVAAPPIGNGAFVFVEHVRRSKLTFAANPDYFKKDQYGGALPYLDGQEIIHIPDFATQLAAFRAGQLDTLVTFPWDSTEDLLRTETEGETAFVRVMEYNTGGNRGSWIQLREPPFDDVRVRRALALIQDREVMIDQGLGGGGHCSSGIPPSWMGRIGPLECSDYGEWYKHDPAKGVALLKEAGYDEMNKLAFDLIIRNTDYAAWAVSMLQIMQQQMNQTGVIDATLKTMTNTEFTALLRSGEWHGLMAGNGPGIGTDLSPFAYKMYTDGSENYSGINDPVLDVLIDAQRGEFDLAKRQDLARQIIDREFDQVWRLWQANPLFAEWSKPYVRDFSSHPLYYFVTGWGAKDLEYVWLDK